VGTDQPPESESTVAAYRLLSYEVGMLDDQIALSLEYATTPDEAEAGRRRIFRLAMPPEAAMRAAMGLLEATRSCIFDEAAPLKSGGKH
jgi:hypothetical protein